MTHSRRALPGLPTWCFILMALCAAAAETQNDPAFDRLAHADMFAFGGVGFAGTISQGEKDLRLIMARPSALADFERLFAVGNIQAKAYALVAIHHLDHAKFAELAAPLRESKTPVQTIHGCIVSHESISSLIARIEAGDYSRSPTSPPPAAKPAVPATPHR